jgi:hypothetical protein
VYYWQTDEKLTQDMRNQSTRHRKDIACEPEGQGQALRVRNVMLMLAAKQIE